MNTPLLTIGRWVAALLVLAGGAIHLKLYFDSYRHIDKVGPSFLLNAAAALVVAIALVAWRHWIPVVAGLLLVDATPFSFGLSRTSRGILDFTEKGWNPSPWAVLSVIIETAAAVVLIGLLVLEWRGRPREAVAAP